MLLEHKLIESVIFTKIQRTLILYPTMKLIAVYIQIKELQPKTFIPPH
jgi:hypothetical protein